MRVKFVPPKRKPKSSSKPASSTATVRRLPRRSPARTKTGSIRNLPAIASAKAEASAKAGRNRPSRSSLLDTRVIFCGDNLRPCAPFVVRSAFRVPHSALTRLLPPLPQGHHPPDGERNPRRRNRQKTGVECFEWTSRTCGETMFSYEEPLGKTGRASPDFRKKCYERIGWSNQHKEGGNANSRRATCGPYTP